MVTLGIETSCDETAAAVGKGGRILSNIVSSSVPFHREFGGVIPEIASRFHIEYIDRVTKQALKKAKKTPGDLDLIAVTERPGLPGSLLVGIAFAKALSYSLGIPLVPVDHLLAHLYANFLTRDASLIRFPFVGAVVSGGHTNIFICRSWKDFKIIGEAKDDAIGEAFDKVAKILGIGYPGGPNIEKYARRFFRFPSGRVGFASGLPIDFPRAYLDSDSFDFSLSGIKTAVLYYVKKNNISQKQISRISWSFQEAVFDVLAERVVKACKKFRINDVLFGGGVVSNMRLRAKLKNVCKNAGVRFFYPPPALCVDNAAMVAGLGEALYKMKG
ncbi:MAG: tRNA (adenosine(37)-N6)-threonylcarbamoyltransferase complex transferase subunit TsaD [Omnitrophica bacterium RBG_13_46_9]|nr:MAG: tRNA (adenosine(37)-N6)-threonylcarbamoyltransferase complex transferase subunit TsaD [Omnitrophica bacterium RBG_13_46_9]